MIFFFVLLLSYYVFCICVYELCLLVLCDGCACLSELNYWGADASEILELRGGGCLVLARVSCMFSVATRQARRIHTRRGGAKLCLNWQV